MPPQNKPEARNQRFNDAIAEMTEGNNLDEWLKSIADNTYKITEGKREALKIRFLASHGGRELLYEGQLATITATYAQQSRIATFQLFSRGKKPHDTLYTDTKMPLLTTRHATKKNTR